jgi:hypothetical protein
MSTPSAESGEGWGWPQLSRKAHYFRGTMSLCRKWMFTGRLDDGSGPASSPDDCATCRRLLAKEAPAPEAPPL